MKAHDLLEQIVAEHLRRYDTVLFNVYVKCYGLETDIDVLGLKHDDFRGVYRAQAVEVKSSRKIVKATEQLHKAYIYLLNEYPSLDSHSICLLHVWRTGYERVMNPTVEEVRQLLRSRIR